MIIRVSLNQQESEDWNTDDKRAKMLARVREMSVGDDIDKVTIHAGQLELVELAPASHRKLAQRLREMDLKVLADLVDPNENTDEVSRAKYADQITRAGKAFMEQPIP